MPKIPNNMGKESPSGTRFYKNKGMKTVTIGIPKPIHNKLSRHSKRESRSLQKTLLRAILQYARKV